MHTGTLSTTAQVGGITIQGTLSKTADSHMAYNPSLPAGKAGSLTTRTDNDTGVATLSAGHGIITGDKVDVYWSGGMRYGMEATVSGNEVTIDAGAGANLPAESTPLVVTKQVVQDFVFDGDCVQLIAMLATRRCHVDFVDAGGVSLFERELAADTPWAWAADTGVTTPITGNAVAQLKVSNGDSAAVCDLKVAVLYD
jgi:hypothetical protein